MIFDIEMVSSARARAAAKLDSGGPVWGKGARQGRTTTRREGRRSRLRGLCAAHWVILKRRVAALVDESQTAAGPEIRSLDRKRPLALAGGICIAAERAGAGGAMQLCNKYHEKERAGAKPPARLPIKRMQKGLSPFLRSDGHGAR
jgi:hypothetical protein